MRERKREKEEKEKEKGEKRAVGVRLDMRRMSSLSAPRRRSTIHDDTAHTPVHTPAHTHAHAHAHALSPSPSPSESLSTPLTEGSSPLTRPRGHTATCATFTPDRSPLSLAGGALDYSAKKKEERKRMTVRDVIGEEEWEKMGVREKRRQETLFEIIDTEQQ